MTYGVARVIASHPVCGTCLFAGARLSLGGASPLERSEPRAASLRSGLRHQDEPPGL